MPRKAQWPPPRHRHPSGQTRCRVKGKDYWLGPWGSEEAERNYARLLMDLTAPAGAAAPGAARRELTVAQAAALWLRGEGPRRDAKELSHYRHALDLLVAECGRLAAADFDARCLERVRGRMVAAGWCRNHANRQTVRLRGVWRWLEREGAAPRGSYEHLRTLPGLAGGDRRVRHSPRVRPAEWADLAKVCRAARREVRAMLLLLWYTGMRPGEVCRVTPGEVDRSGGVWVYRPARHKNAWRGQARAVTLGPVAQKVLAPWLEGRGDGEYAFEPSTRCPQRKRLCYSPESFAQVVRRAAKKAGVDGFHAYRARHSARLRVTREMGLDAARSMLGHTSLGTTNEYAAGVDQQTAEKVARKMG